MTKVFISYSHVDETFCDMLQKHLAALKHQGVIETWHDRRIKAGDEFENKIDQQLNEADIILLLVSSDFIASRYCYEIEMARAIERHDAVEARVIPVILRPCDWHDTPFGKLMAVPKDGKAVKSWPDMDEAFLDIVKAIKSVIGKHASPQVSVAAVETIGSSKVEVVKQPRSANLRIKKEFSEAEIDIFLESGFEFISAYFENSLAELADRNPQLTARFRRTDSNHFTSVIYDNGKAVGRCKVSLGGMFGRSIGFSHNDQADDNSFNESLSVECDDQHMFFRSMGMAINMGQGTQNLTQEGAAELYWSMLIHPLQ